MTFFDGTSRDTLFQALAKAKVLVVETLAAMTKAPARSHGPGEACSSGIARVPACSHDGADTYV